MKNKIVVCGCNSYKNWLGEDLINQIEESTGLIIFTGGADVPPMLYKEKNVASYSDYKRIEEYIEAYNYGLENDIPMLGICLGSQFLTAMQPNGKVIQDVDNHGTGGTHSITDGINEFEMTSTHHQMMNPFKIPNREIIAWSTINRSSNYITGIGNISIEIEPEIVYYPKSKALAIQGHPEFGNCPEETKDYCRKLIKKYLINK